MVMAQASQMGANDPYKSDGLAARMEKMEDLFTRLKTSNGDFGTLTEELRHLDQSPDEYWYAMGSRLQKILRERLYRGAGYRSFSDYCSRGLGYSRQHSYKLMKEIGRAHV